MTRAKDDLHLIVPQRFFTHRQSAQGDRHVYASRTRFIPDGLLNLFNKTAWPVIAAEARGIALRRHGGVEPARSARRQSARRKWTMAAPTKLTCVIKRKA
jgi:DNA helicase-2/ATP-dependent DNA helicase PcrA